MIHGPSNDKINYFNKVAVSSPFTFPHEVVMLSRMSDIIFPIFKKNLVLYIIF